MSRLFISAAHKSSGKTTVCVGLCAALRARGEVVQPFKKGPDYIDPLWLALAAGRPCYNLDAYLMGAEEIRAQVARSMRGATLGLIEGNKGLYDGLDLEGSNSNAAMAALLGTPVVLVIDARGMTRGIAPLILGYQAFDKNIRIAGVILNQLGGTRHEAKLRAVIQHYTGVPVLGAVQHDERMTIVERHLGLVPSNEAQGARGRIDEIAAHIAAQVDLESVAGHRRQAAPLPGASRRRRRLAARRCASASRAMPRSASTIRATWTPCARPGRNWWTSAPCTTATCRRSTACSSAADSRKRTWTRSPRTRACAASCARRSRPACRPTPSAAG